MGSKEVGNWVLAIALAAIYIAAGVPKLLGASEPVVLFATLGYPDWFRIVIGLVETLAGLALLVPQVTRWAALLLMVEMLGAIVSYVAAGALPSAWGPVAMIVLLAALFWMRRPAQA